MRSPRPASPAAASSAARIAIRKRLERSNLAAMGDRLRAIGVVERQHRRLREDVGRAEARRMLRVALDLGRAPFVALDEQADADPPNGIAVA